MEGWPNPPLLVHDEDTVLREEEEEEEEVEAELP